MTPTSTPRREGALFRRDGDLLVPGVLTRGPWYHDTLHGSAMLAAVARAAEQHPSEVDRQVVRLTVDMMRAAPMTALRIESSTVRQGKSIDTVDIAMYADGELCVRGSALRIRTAELVVDELEAAAAGAAAPVPPSPEQELVPPLWHTGAERPAFHHAIDVHVDRQTAVVWFRLAVPVVEGEPTSGFVAVATIADWTYATPHLLRTVGEAAPPAERTVFAINADTTVNSHRPLHGDWVGLRTTSYVGGLGAGTSSAQLFDAAGPLGFTTQSVLVRGPSGAPLSVRELSG
jgi:acyl-coenzyme A thioesterase PaaI-like protein